MLQNQGKGERVSQRNFKRRTEINRTPLNEINFSDASMIQMGKMKLESMVFEDSELVNDQGPAKRREGNAK